MICGIGVCSVREVVDVQNTELKVQLIHVRGVCFQMSMSDGVKFKIGLEGHFFSAYQVITVLICFVNVSHLHD